MSYTPDLDEARMPDRRTLRQRASLPRQAWRFLVLDIRMLRVIAKGHSGD